MRRPFSLAIGVFVAGSLAAVALAAERQRIEFSSGPAGGLYRIELSNGRQIVASGLPVARGSVVTFRPASGGALTGVPREMVVRIEPGAEGVEESALGATASIRDEHATVVTATPAAPLQPGDLVILGPTGEPAPPAQTAEAAAAPPPPAGNGAYGVGGGYGSGGASAYGIGGPGANVINRGMTAIGPDGLPRVLSSTDLSRALASSTPVGSNGFPATTTNAPTVIGPNGTPTLAPGVSESSAPVIGPNGTPVMGSGQTVVVGPNGSPIVSGAGQPGSVGPVIGPNGTPVLAPAGQPGAAAPVIGPNGTPVLAAPGQPGSGAAAPTTAPNGTPASPPPAGAAPPPAGPSGGAKP